VASTLPGNGEIGWSSRLSRTFFRNESSHASDLLGQVPVDCKMATIWLIVGRLTGIVSQQTDMSCHVLSSRPKRRQFSADGRESLLPDNMFDMTW
jgi:hypothetical protein